MAMRYMGAGLTGTSRIQFRAQRLAAICPHTSHCLGILRRSCETVRIEPYEGWAGQVQIDGKVLGTLPAEQSPVSRTLGVLALPGFRRNELTRAIS